MSNQQFSMPSRAVRCVFASIDSTMRARQGWFLPALAILLLGSRLTAFGSEIDGLTGDPCFPGWEAFNVMPEVVESWGGMTSAAALDAPARLVLGRIGQRADSLVNGDVPSRWGTLSYGALELKIQIPRIDTFPVEAVRLWIDGEQAETDRLQKGSVALGTYQGITTEEWTYHWNCPPLGRHFIQAVYRRGDVWSVMSQPVRFELLPPPTPSIIAVGKDNQTPQPFSVPKAVSLSGTATIKLANVRPNDMVAIDVDGEQVSTAMVSPECCITLSLSSQFVSGRYRLNVRTTSSQGCGITSGPSPSVWVDLHDHENLVTRRDLIGNRTLLWTTIAPAPQIHPTVPTDATDAAKINLAFSHSVIDNTSSNPSQSADGAKKVQDSRCVESSRLYDAPLPSPIDLPVGCKCTEDRSCLSCLISGSPYVTLVEVLWNQLGSLIGTETEAMHGPSISPMAVPENEWLSLGGTKPDASPLPIESCKSSWPLSSWQDLLRSRLNANTALSEEIVDAFEQLKVAPMEQLTALDEIESVIETLREKCGHLTRFDASSTCWCPADAACEGTCQRDTQKEFDEMKQELAEAVSLESVVSLKISQDLSKLYQLDQIILVPTGTSSRPDKSMSTYIYSTRINGVSDESLRLTMQSSPIERWRLRAGPVAPFQKLIERIEDQKSDFTDRWHAAQQDTKRLLEWYPAAMKLNDESVTSDPMASCQCCRATDEGCCLAIRERYAKSVETQTTYARAMHEYLQSLKRRQRTAELQRRDLVDLIRDLHALDHRAEQLITLAKSLHTDEGRRLYATRHREETRLAENVHRMTTQEAIDTLGQQQDERLAQSAEDRAKIYWNRVELRDQARTALRRHAPDTTTHFHTAAHFPLPRHGYGGLDDERGGLLIREGMKLQTRADGSFDLEFDIARARIPAELFLQIEFQATDGGPWHTVTLRPEKVAAEAGEGIDFFGNLDRESYWMSVKRSGHHPALEASGGRVVATRRKGSVRYGHGFRGLGVYERTAFANAEN